MASNIGTAGATTGCPAKGGGGIDVERACRLKPNKFVARGNKESWGATT
jgi:hypothetical protein